MVIIMGFKLGFFHSQNEKIKNLIKKSEISENIIIFLRYDPEIDYNKEIFEFKKDFKGNSEFYLEFFTHFLYQQS